MTTLPTLPRGLSISLDTHQGGSADSALNQPQGQELQQLGLLENACFTGKRRLEKISLKEEPKQLL